MNSYIECLPCLGKNAVDAAKRSTDDPAIRQMIVQKALELLAQSPLNMPPPYFAAQILKIARQYAPAKDLYAEEKKRSNALAERMVAELPNIREYIPGDFESGLRLAIAGNILDFGVYHDLNIERAMESIRKTLTSSLDQNNVRRLKEKMDVAERILYVLDNCGEAVFDRIFMEPYRHKITLTVRGCPVFNDVTADDLDDCGLKNFTAGWIISSEIGIPGTILRESTDEFRTVYHNADLIIAKGQGNFETMNENPESIAFLFLAKCPVVTRLLGAATNSIQLILNNF